MRETRHRIFWGLAGAGGVRTVRGIGLVVSRGTAWARTTAPRIRGAWSRRRGIPMEWPFVGMIVIVRVKGSVGRSVPLDIVLGTVAVNRNSALLMRRVALTESTCAGLIVTAGARGLAHQPLNIALASTIAQTTHELSKMHSKRAQYVFKHK